MDECPALKEHARDIDNILAKALPEAKHYASKQKGKEETNPKSKGKKHVGSGKTTTGNKVTKGKGKKSANPSRAQLTKGKGKNRDDPSRQQMPKDGERLGTSGTQLSEYERGTLPKRILNKALLHAVKSSGVADVSGRNLKSGNEIVVSYKGEPLATGVFIRYLDDMYCEVGFGQHLTDMEEEDVNPKDIELPIPVPENKDSNRKEKLFFNELEADDIYTWKVERVSPNDTRGGYVLGIKDVDIFKPPAVEGPRIRRPNSLYSDYC